MQPPSSFGVDTQGFIDAGTAPAGMATGQPSHFREQFRLVGWPTLYVTLRTPRLSGRVVPFVGATEVSSPNDQANLPLVRRQAAPQSKSNQHIHYKNWNDEEQCLHRLTEVTAGWARSTQ